MFSSDPKVSKLKRTENCGIIVPHLDFFFVANFRLFYSGTVFVKLIVFDRVFLLFSILGSTFYSLP